MKALLTQLDQIKHLPNVLVLATSNVVDAIDDAFVDRADIVRYIGPPSTAGRYQILQTCVSEMIAKKLVLMFVYLPFVHSFFPFTVLMFPMASLGCSFGLLVWAARLGCSFGLLVRAARLGWCVKSECSTATTVRTWCIGASRHHPYKRATTWLTDDATPYAQHTYKAPREHHLLLQDLGDGPFFHERVVQRQHVPVRDRTCGPRCLRPTVA
jgi:hypothetical protein